MIRAGGSRDGQPAPSGSTEVAEASSGTAGPDTVAEPGTAGESAAGSGTVGANALDPGLATAAGQPGQSAGRGIRAAYQRAIGRAWVRHLALLMLFEAAGIAVTWPRLTFLFDGKLPYTPDTASYVWDMWWVAHQLVHLGNPFTTSYMAAPAGAQLAFNTTLPLAGWLMAPVTLVLGPSASFTLLTVITPGLLCYAMYRAARLWLNAPGAITAGAFFGLSSMILWQDWYHVNIAIGTIFLPLVIEAAVRFRRDPRRRPAVALGLALGASVLVNQESAVLAVALAALILVPWIIGKLARDRASLRQLAAPLGLGAAAALLLASPQLIAMGQQVAAGGTKLPAGELALNYTQFGVPLPTMFAPSPRLAHFGLGWLASAYSFNNELQLREAVPTFGAALTGLALLGVVIGWRKRTTWGFLALWLCCAALALGTSLTIGGRCNFNQVSPGNQWGRSCHQYMPLLTHMGWTHVLPQKGTPFWAQVQMSNLMPYTWLTRIPWLGRLREADRFEIVGLIGAAMLAGLTVQWLSRRRGTRPLIAVVAALAVLECGWSGLTGATMPTVMPRLDRPISRDHTNSIVVDVPFGERGGVAAIGSALAPNSLLIATHDGHPRAISYTSWVTSSTRLSIEAHPFYWNLMSVQQGGTPSPGQIRRIIADLKTLHIGWVIEWRNIWTRHHPGERYAHVDKYLRDVGFRRVRIACVVGLRSVSTCPTHPVDQQVWLYQYLPGHP